MSRLTSRVVGLLALAASPALAQGNSELAFSAAPTSVHFSYLGASVPSWSMQWRLTRHYNRAVGFELGMFGLFADDARQFVRCATADGDCVPATLDDAQTWVNCASGQYHCETVHSPESVYGAFASAFVRLGGRLRVGAGVGAVSQSGSVGPSRRSTEAWQAGADFALLRTGPVTLTAGARLVKLRVPLFGAKRVFLPGVGLSF